MVYGIGGAPEGVAAAAAIRALGGDMQARLIPRNEVKGDTEENRKIAAEEVQRCEALGVKVNEILKLEDLVRDDILFLPQQELRMVNYSKGFLVVAT